MGDWKLAYTFLSIERANLNLFTSHWSRMTCTQNYDITACNIKDTVYSWDSQVQKECCKKGEWELANIWSHHRTSKVNNPTIIIVRFLIIGIHSKLASDGLSSSYFLLASSPSWRSLKIFYNIIRWSIPHTPVWNPIIKGNFIPSPAVHSNQGPIILCIITNAIGKFLLENKV